jgi:hypothetical protein
MRNPAPNEVTSNGTEHEDVYQYLDDLRDSGVTNMFGADPYVQREFDLERKEARSLVTAWMQSF